MRITWVHTYSAPRKYWGMPADKLRKAEIGNPKSNLTIRFQQFSFCTYNILALLKLLAK